jgi:transketolase
MEEIRDCFVDELIKLKKEDDRLHVLVSDSTSTCRIKPFMEKFPGAVINTGIAEQNMVGIASGMSLGGLIPFTANAAPFLMGRSNEQVKTDICYSNTNVKLVGLNPGFAYGPLGPTHHCLDDISTVSAFGNIQIFAPCDPEETRQITRYAASYDGPVYIRLDSFRAENIHSSDYRFIPGEPAIISEGGDISLICLGTMVHEAIAAACKLSADGIKVDVVSLPSIRPLNPASLIASLEKTGAALTLEEHSMHGGIGSIACDIILDNRIRCLLKRAGVPAGSFAEAAPREDLKKLYGLDTEGIIRAAKQLIEEKA